MVYPPVVVVDEQDQPVGSAMLAEVLQKGLYHRIVAIFVVDDHDRMLLQLRSANVAIYPHCWDQAAGGHVDEGQDYDQAAQIEVAEELGLHDVPLEELGTYRTNNRDGERIINRFERVYAARVPHDVLLQPEAHEITELRWFTPAELAAERAAHPEMFTPGLQYGLQTYFPQYCPDSVDG